MQQNHPIAYAAWVLKGAELSDAAIEKEILAVLFFH